MDQQPNFDLKTYGLTYRLFYLAFAMSIAPFVWEATDFWIHDHTSQFTGDLYYPPFWIAWGAAAVGSCILAAALDTIRAQGMCISLAGTWYLFRIFINIFDRTDPGRYYTAVQWVAWLVVIIVLSYHLSFTRPGVTHLYVYHQNRLTAFKQAKRQLAEMEADRVEAEGEQGPEEYNDRTS